MIREERLLLVDVHPRRRADVELQLDHLEHLGCDPDVVAGDAETVARRQGLKIGVQHCGDRRDFDDVAVEAAGVGEKPRGAGGVLILAPKSIS